MTYGVLWLKVQIPLTRTNTQRHGIIKNRELREQYSSSSSSSSSSNDGISRMSSGRSVVATPRRRHTTAGDIERRKVSRRIHEVIKIYVI